MGVDPSPVRVGAVRETAGGRTGNEAVMTGEFIWPVRVYYEDTDAGGVVYHTNYLKFMERARTEWLRQFGIEQDQLRREAQVIFAVRALSVKYIHPASFNEQVVVITLIEKRRRASLVFDQRIVRPKHAKLPDNFAASAGLLCRASVDVVCLDSHSWRPRPLPAALKVVIGS